MAGEDEGLTKSFATLRGAIGFGNKRFGFKGASPLVEANAGRWSAHPFWMRVTPYKLSGNRNVQGEWRDPYDDRVIGVVWH